MPKVKIRRFVDSIRPEVTLKKGAVCSLKLHFYGCLRQYVNAIEYKAQIDPERFVYATDGYFVDYCKRYTRKDGQGEAYKLRMIKCCKQFLRETGIISGQVKRIRKGRLYTGFIVIEHDLVAHAEGCTCRILSESALGIALRSALSCALSSALPNDENGVLECPIECPSTPSEVIHHKGTSSDSEQKSLGFAEMESVPNAVNTDNAANAENAESEFEGVGVGLETRLKTDSSRSAQASLSPVQLLNLELQTFGRGKGRSW